MTEKQCLGKFPLADEPNYEGMLQCMRCGFCLPTCPTYVLTGRERSSPRGRVALAKAVADEQLDFTAALKEEAYFCLDCRACSTSCPSGVHAGQVNVSNRGVGRHLRIEPFCQPLDPRVSDLDHGHIGLAGSRVPGCFAGSSDGLHCRVHNDPMRPAGAGIARLIPGDSAGFRRYLGCFSPTG